MKGKVAIVTGASSGMERDTAYYYAKEGANVIAAARRAERLQQLIEESKGLGSRRWIHSLKSGISLPS